MKFSIFKTDKINCIISNEQFTKKEIHSKSTIISIENKLQVSIVDFEITGEAYVVWPNREGEGFDLTTVYDRFLELKLNPRKLTLSYPATASITAFYLEDSRGACICFYMEKDQLGTVRNIELISKSPHSIIIRIKALHNKWVICSGESKSHLIHFFHSSRNNREKLIKRQFQLGLIDGSGKSHVPKTKGFMIIPEIAQLLSNEYEAEGNSLHIFGYAEGHDLMYPLYEPSIQLGGIKVLKEALKQLKKLNFKSSFYLNGRIIDREFVRENPHWIDSLLKGSDKKPLEEHYNHRVFYIVDPSSLEWQDHLIERAILLKDCGADAVQIDQIGGRAALKGAGEIWGYGYSRLIQEIHYCDLQIWIQGVSDYYNADWFEMTFRDLNILKGGILRGGNPLGHTDLILMKLFLEEKLFLINKSKLKEINNVHDLNFIVDYPDLRGKLPLYDENYMSKMVHRKSS